MTAAWIARLAGLTAGLVAALALALATAPAQAFAALIESEIAKWAKVVRASGAKPD